MTIESKKSECGSSDTKKTESTKASDKTQCLPAGDCLPFWSKIPLDSKLPMMNIPKGAVVLCTTKLGEPKHTVKQEIDFDLRDPYGKYIPNEYEPLHDPHLKAHFSTHLMTKHLIKKGFISKDKKVKCSLKKFNQYRRYLRYCRLLEIADERLKELKESNKVKSSSNEDVEAKPLKGSLLRSRVYERRGEDKQKLLYYLLMKDENIASRIKERDTMIAMKTAKRREEDRKQHVAITEHQEEATRLSRLLEKKWKQTDRMRTRLIKERQQARIQTMEQKCLEKWDSRKQVQQLELDRDQETLKREEEERSKSIARRGRLVAKQREKFEEKMNQMKMESREQHRQREEMYARGLEKKLQAAANRIWNQRRDRRKSPSGFRSTWSLEETLNKLNFSDLQVKTRKENDAYMSALNAAIDQDNENDDAALQAVASEIVKEALSNVQANREKELHSTARNFVKGVISKITDEIYPAYLQMLADDDSQTVGPSQSVRFTQEVEEIPYRPMVIVTCPDNDEELSEKENGDEMDDEDEKSLKFRPIGEHIVTPVASNVRLSRTTTPTSSFVETLLIRLLDDLNGGRLTRDEIMKLASYSMEILKTAPGSIPSRTPTPSQDRDDEHRPIYSSSSLVAERMVDFTLGKILHDIQSGKVDQDDMAALIVSTLEDSSDNEDNLSDTGDSDVDEFVDDAIRDIQSSAGDSLHETSPVCDALLDEFMLTMLKSLIKDLEDEALTREQVKAIASSVKEGIENGDIDIQHDADIHTHFNILTDLLNRMQSGEMDIAKLHQIVFAIVHPYSMMKYPEDQNFETRITDLLKTVLTSMKTNASTDQENTVIMNIIDEATIILSQTDLNADQVKVISPTIIDREAVKANKEDEQAIEESLNFLQMKLKAEQPADEAVIKSIVQIASAIVTNSPIRADTRTPMKSVCQCFLDILKQLRQLSKTNSGMENVDGEQVDFIIKQITEGRISEENVLKMATSVASSLRVTVEEDIAESLVESTLNKIRDEMTAGQMKQAILDGIIEGVYASYRSIIACDTDTISTLNALSSMLKSVLSQVTYKIQYGEFTESDIRDLSESFKDSVNNVHGEHNKAGIVQRLNKFVEELDTFDLEYNEAEDIGQRLITCGKQIVRTFADNDTSVEDLSQGVVDDVIRAIQLEIDRGALPSHSLKEIAKTYIEVTDIDKNTTVSISEGTVGYTISGLYLDLEQERPISILSSVAMSNNRAESGFSGDVTSRVISIINNDIKKNGIPMMMAYSMSNSFASLATAKDKQGDDKILRKTMATVIDCLRKDNLSCEDVHKLFSMILESYQEKRLSNKSGSESVHDSTLLSNEDMDLVNNLVQETLERIRKSIRKDHTEYPLRTSIPSPSTDLDWSLYASDLVSKTLKHIREDMEETQRRDISDFIIEIVQQLLSGLNEGSISKISMAQFYLMVDNEATESASLEEQAAQNLFKIITDIKEKRMNSKFTQRIIETYLAPEQSVDGVFTNPVKAIESIMMTVSTEILTKFVRATLHNILYELQENRQGRPKSPSNYALRSAVSGVAEHIIKQVVLKVNHAVQSSSKPQERPMSREEFDRIASRLASSPREVAISTPVETGVKQQEVDNVLGTQVDEWDVENIVIETLHNIVSNLRLEFSMSTGENQEEVRAKGVSQEIQDFVLQNLQNIVTDIQDKRVLYEFEKPKMNENSERPASRASSCDENLTAAYINEVLLTSILELKEAKLSQKKTKLSTEHDPEYNSLCLEISVLDCLKNVVSDLALLDTRAVKQQQAEDVKKIIIESMRQTIENIRADKLSQDELFTVAKAMTKCAEHYPDLMTKKVSLESDVSKDDLAELAENILSQIETEGIDDQKIQRLAVQLATLGLDAFQMYGASMPAIDSSHFSVRSSEVNDMVKDVLRKISFKLETDDGSETYLPRSPIPVKVQLTAQVPGNDSSGISVRSSEVSGMVQNVLEQIKLTPGTEDTTEVGAYLPASPVPTAALPPPDNSSNSFNSSQINQIVKGVLHNLSAAELPETTGTYLPASRNPSYTQGADINTNRKLSASSCFTSHTDMSNISVNISRPNIGSDAKYIKKSVSSEVKPKSVAKKQSDKEMLCPGKPVKETKKTTVAGTRTNTGGGPVPRKQSLTTKEGVTVGKSSKETDIGAAARSSKKDSTKTNSSNAKLSQTKITKARSNHGRSPARHMKSPLGPRSKESPANRYVAKVPARKKSSGPGTRIRGKSKEKTENRSVSPKVRPKTGSPGVVQKDVMTSTTSELKSLCGVHKTSIRLLDRETNSTVSSSDEERSFTSEVF